MIVKRTVTPLKKTGNLGEAHCSCSDCKRAALSRNVIENTRIIYTQKPMRRNLYLNYGMFYADHERRGKNSKKFYLSLPDVIFSVSFDTTLVEDKKKFIFKELKVGCYFENLNEETRIFNLPLGNINPYGRVCMSGIFNGAYEQEEESFVKFVISSFWNAEFNCAVNDNLSTYYDHLSLANPANWELLTKKDPLWIPTLHDVRSYYTSNRNF